MPTPDLALAILEGAAFLLLVTSVWSVQTHQLEEGIYLLATQGVLLAVAAAVVATEEGGHAYVAVALAVAVKVVAVPALLLHALRDVRTKHEVQLVIPRSFALLIATFLTSIIGLVQTSI